MTNGLFYSGNRIFLIMSKSFKPSLLRRGLFEHKKISYKGNFLCRKFLKSTGIFMHPKIQTNLCLQKLKISETFKIHILKF